MPRLRYTFSLAPLAHEAIINPELQRTLRDHPDASAYRIEIAEGGMYYRQYAEAVTINGETITIAWPGRKTTTRVLAPRPFDEGKTYTDGYYSAEAMREMAHWAHDAQAGGDDLRRAVNDWLNNPREWNRRKHTIAGGIR